MRKLGDINHIGSTSSNLTGMVVQILDEEIDGSQRIFKIFSAEYFAGGISYTGAVTDVSISLQEQDKQFFGFMIPYKFKGTRVLMIMSQLGTISFFNFKFH